MTSAERARVIVEQLEDYLPHGITCTCGECSHCLYLDTVDIIRSLLADNERMRAGLENIVKHQFIVGGSFSNHSAITKIAREALADRP